MSDFQRSSRGLVLSPLSPLSRKKTRADLEGGVTDEGIRALASAGCGRSLTSLTLAGLRWGVWYFSFDAGRESVCVDEDIFFLPALLLFVCFPAKFSQG